jgi:fatty acid desaturase
VAKTTTCKGSPNPVARPAKRAAATRRTLPGEPFRENNPENIAIRWSWLQGALATVDRSFGALLDNRLHCITNTHVCHHIFPKIPFYHAREATAALSPVLGPYYLKDDTPILAALWRAWCQCKFVEDEGDVVFPISF